LTRKETDSIVKDTLENKLHPNSELGLEHSIVKTLSDLLVNQ